MNDKIEKIDELLDHLDELQSKYPDFKDYIKDWLMDQEIPELQEDHA